ncbi:MAG: AAA family ATPase [Acetatifactor sp.]
MEMKEQKLNCTLEEAADWVRSYMQHKNLSQTAMAKKLDISGGALSSYLSGKYPTPERITAKVQELMELTEQKTLAPKAPEFAETTVTNMVKQAIAYAHMRGVVSVAYGDAGVGKTTAVQRYLQENQLAIGITILPTYASLTGVNELLSEALGVRERTDRKITREIINRLKGSGRVIIVDEAQHLTPRAIEHLRSISDMTQIGICFVGNERIYTNLLGNRKTEYAQLFSRIGVRKMVTVNTNNKEDIRKIFDFGLDEQSIEILYKISRTNFGLRGAVNVYINTVGVYDEVTPENLARIVKDMNIAA